MHVKTVLVALVGITAVAEATELPHRSLFANTLSRRQNNRGGRNGGQQGGGRNGGNQGGNNGGNQGGNNGGNNNNGGGGGRALTANLVQSASADDGNNPGADGQAASAT